MRIPESVIMEIKDKNPIEDVISPYVNIKRAGRNLKGLCPFHSEKTPSFVVYPESSSYYCFGCGAGGDQINFVRQIENLDYVEAIHRLADRAGVIIPEGEVDDSYAKLKQRIYEINRETARFYNRYLFTPQGKWALDYLTDRGLTVKTINHFGLGVAPDDWDQLLKFLKDKHFTITEMEQANVIAKGSRGGYYDRFRKRVMFPIIDLRGNVIGFSGRRAPDEERGGKYINTADTPVYKKSKSIFGMNFAKNCCAERILVVEGNMDVVSLHQAGFENTIATLGTAFTDEHARVLSRYTKEVVLSFDSDAAGQKAAARAMEVLGQTGLSVRVLSVPEGKDPDEFIKNNGAERFRAVLDGAVSEIEFRLHSAAKGLDINSSDGKTKYLNRAAAQLAQLSDTIAIDLYAGKLAEECNVSKTVLAEKIKALQLENRKKRQKEQIRQIVQPKIRRDEVNPFKNQNPAAVTAEEEILAIFIRHPDLLKQFEQDDLFLSPLNIRLLKDLRRLLAEDSTFDVSLLAQDYSPEEIGYIVSLNTKRENFLNPAESLKQATVTLQKNADKTKLQESIKRSDQEWADEITKIIRMKKGENL